MPPSLSRVPLSFIILILQTVIYWPRFAVGERLSSLTHDMVHQSGLTSTGTPYPEDPTGTLQQPANTLSQWILTDGPHAGIDAVSKINSLRHEIALLRRGGVAALRETPDLFSLDPKTTLANIGSTNVPAGLDPDIIGPELPKLKDQKSVNYSEDLIIAIDGVSGAGKSSVARAISLALDIPYLETGAIYRSLGIMAERNPEIDLNRLAEIRRELKATNLDEKQRVTLSTEQGLIEEKITSLLDNLHVKFEKPLETDPTRRQRVILNGEDITEAISGENKERVGKLASLVSQIPSVREELKPWQQSWAADHGACVTEGRDTCTEVFPATRFKFYFDASPEQRAKWRAKEILGGLTPDDELLAEIARQMKERDDEDRNRPVAPLRQDPDAIVINSESGEIRDLTLQMFGHIIAKLEKFRAELIHIDTIAQ